MDFIGVGGEVGVKDDDDGKKGAGGRDGCGVWRVDVGGRWADMSARAAAREVGDGARSMSGGRWLERAWGRKGGK